MIALYLLLVFAAVTVFLTLRGRTIWDKLLCATLVSAKVVVIIVLVASLWDLIYLLDFAMIYALLGMIGTMFLAIYFGRRKGKSQGALETEREEDRP